LIGEYDMPKSSRRNGSGPRPATATKYDAHHNVLNKTYGAFADLRRELSDSKAAVAERVELLKLFSSCNRFPTGLAAPGGLLRAPVLSRKDFTSHDWWPRLMAAMVPPPRRNGHSVPARQSSPADRIAGPRQF